MDKLKVRLLDFFTTGVSVVAEIKNQTGSIFSV